MIVIIHARRFDLQDELRYFIETCLQMLPSGVVKIEALKLSLGEEDSVIKRKYCAINAEVSGDNYLITQYANSYEEAVVMSVRELNLKIRKNMRPFSRSTE